MHSTRNFVLRIVLLLSLILSITEALTCKTCERTDPSCTTPSVNEVHQCEHADDVCYSWFHRTIDTTVQRGCMSTNSVEYTIIKDMINHHNQGCVKRMRAFNCFTFCSFDLCN